MIPALFPIGDVRHARRRRCGVLAGSANKGFDELPILLGAREYIYLLVLSAHPNQIFGFAGITLSVDIGFLEPIGVIHIVFLLEFLNTTASVNKLLLACEEWMTC